MIGRSMKGKEKDLAASPVRAPLLASDQISIVEETLYITDAAETRAAVPQRATYLPRDRELSNERF